MSESAPIEHALLGQVLPDATTGLPSILYFRLVREWEERRAQRTGTRVRVIRLTVRGAVDRDRRLLPKKLCHELRQTDLIASDGPTRYYLLLTSPDAESLGAVMERVQQVIEALNKGRKVTEVPLEMDVQVEEDYPGIRERGPCEPCDLERLGDSGERLRFGEAQPD
jgi:hypothetical protein